ncbi:high frequency lysogenization protein HflD [Pasteurellaceae bacterium HPA106]|uniref:high frequency lysogenization protein HflD n=1 Tax=Spirabiliibacterium pneumoniae TaxID=221400 RepID=UPI001AADD43B|nr:high frequency lysogenization protein HflD [Spirabiliibacterium pneumoniae]MBE2895988.1 high frequency lysogenization protein HflD [Spirabiliibacterium pneumoniae]
MANPYTDLTMALAGVCQSAKLVHQFSHQGVADENAMRTSLKSLLNTAPSDTLDVYGGDLANLRLGLTTLLEQFGGHQGQFDAELGRYWMSLLVLENKLNKNTQAKSQLGVRIGNLMRQHQHVDLLDDQFLASVASVYVDVISPLGAKIQVKGSPLYLQQIAIHHRIRSALLCGMRSAVLWRQCGGSRLKLFFARKAYFQTAQQLLASIE